jgi:histidinol-phosphate aminotransferase
MSESIFRKELAAIKPYVPGRPIEEVRREYGLTRIEKLASNENPLGPSPKALEAMRAELERVHLYPDAQAFELRTALAAHNGLAPANIVVTNGGEHLLEILPQILIEPGDEAVIPAPSFDLYTSTVAMMGGKPVIVPLAGNDHDFDAMLRAIGPRTKLVYVCNPNNPTGNIMSRASFDAFAAALPDHVVLFLDEAYYEYACRDPEYPDGVALLKARPNTVILRTFSKVGGIAGIRVAYGMCSEPIAQALARVRGTFMVNRIAQAGALGALADTEHLRRTVELNERSLGAMCAWFDAHGYEYVPSRANFVFVDLRRDSRELFDLLMKQGVIVRPGALWGRTTWMRISSGSMDQTEFLLHKLEAVLGV